MITPCETPDAGIVSDERPLQIVPLSAFALIGDNIERYFPGFYLERTPSLAEILINKIPASTYSELCSFAETAAYRYRIGDSQDVVHTSLIEFGADLQKRHPDGIANDDAIWDEYSSIEYLRGVVVIHLRREHDKRMREYGARVTYFDTLHDDYLSYSTRVESELAVSEGCGILERDSLYVSGEVVPLEEKEKYFVHAYMSAAGNMDRTAAILRCSRSTAYGLLNSLKRKVMRVLAASASILLILGFALFFSWVFWRGSGPGEGRRAKGTPRSRASARRLMTRRTVMKPSR